MLRVDVTPGPRDTPCWVWKGHKQTSGYGQIWVREHYGKLAHHLGHELFVGEIPDGLEPDHLCRNRACCNPAHLEWVSHKVNIERGETAAGLRNQTHCKRGHEFTPENTKRKATKWGRGWARQCLTCRREQGAIYQRNRRIVARGK